MKTIKRDCKDFGFYGFSKRKSLEGPKSKVNIFVYFPKLPN
jgi:hypothetical protein